MSITFKQRLLSVPPLFWLLLLATVCLLPFVGKAFFVDDTLFLRAAEQIQKHPLNFYGFNINWYGYTTPMTLAMDNPPLTSYYIALAASLLGWSEPALHLAFLFPALAAVWGIFVLAKNYCDRPFTAALIALLTPVFLISATTVMSDVTQLAFWVWTLVFFEKGLRTEKRADFIISGILAGLAFLTKYPGLSLVPLLLAYGFCVKRRTGGWLTAPVIPLVFVAVYQWVTFRLYGEGLLLCAAHEATKFRAHAYVAPWEQAVIGATFAGACFVPVLIFTPWLWPRRMVLAMLCLIAAGLLVIPHMAAYATLIWKADGQLNWGRFFYIAILTVAGLYVILLAVMDLWERRDAVSVLLLLWLTGIFVFAVGLNWTISGRSFLPAVPAVGILAARRMSRKYTGPTHNHFLQLALPALMAGVVGLVLVKADYDMANAQRAAAMHLGAKYQMSGKTVWFNDHWGFQYYIEQFGAKALEQRTPGYRIGNILIITSHASDFGSNNFSIGSSGRLRLIESGEIIGRRHLATADPGVEAGFYGTCVGVLPFAIGNLGPQYFRVFEIVGTAGSSQSKKTPVVINSKI